MRNFLTAGFEPGALPIRSMLPKFAEMGGLEPPCSFRHHAPFQGGPIPVMGHFHIVGPGGFEPPTRRASTCRSTKLSYSPIKNLSSALTDLNRRSVGCNHLPYRTWLRAHIIIPKTGVEPACCMRIQRRILSPGCLPIPPPRGNSLACPVSNQDRRLQGPPCYRYTTSQ